MLRVFALLSLGLSVFAESTPSTTPDTTIPPPADPVATLKVAENAHVDIYKRFGPAVVGISAKAASKPNIAWSGTGAVISPDGLILSATTTVPPEATEITIYFTDGRVQKGTIVETAEAVEGAVVKTDGEKLPFMQLTDSAECQVGDPVYSWGNPFYSIQQDGAVCIALGTISGLYTVSSASEESNYIGPVIETDAAINPGSDGGPLTDANGNLVGIISCAYSRTRWLGLAVPTRKLIDALPSLKKLTLAKRADLTGDRLSAWAQQQMFADSSKKLEKSVVGIAVADQPEPLNNPVGDKLVNEINALAAKLADNRATEQLAKIGKFPRQYLAFFETRRPFPNIATGFVVDASGIVATSAFNLGAKHTGPYYVYLPGGEKVDATLLGADDYYDLALLKLSKATGLQAVQLGDSSRFAQGKSVAVIGRSESPGTLTVNCGTVSATGRYDRTCCQISSLIDYGNLGGPVIDLQGRVVGMATHLGEKTYWRQNCGVGFMLQAEHIRKLIPDLKAGKTIEQPKRPMLGVQGDMGAIDIKGARISHVADNGPAAAAGIKEKDVVTQFNGKTIVDFLSLHKAVKECKVGQKVMISLRREDKFVNVTVVIGQQE